MTINAPPLYATVVKTDCEFSSEGHIYMTLCSICKSGSKFVDYLFPGAQNPGSEKREETCLFLHHQDVS